MLHLKISIQAEIPEFLKMESAKNTSEFILPYNNEKHHMEYEKNDIYYLSIYKNYKLIGFAIVVLDPDQTSVELRRIVISNKNRGHGEGQQSIGLIENFCKNRLKRKRIWLNVFKNNKRAKYIYEKLGYSLYQIPKSHDMELLFYQKMLE